MSRNISVSNIAWDPGDDPAVAELLRQEQCTGVEIAPTMRWASPLGVPAAEVAAYRGWWEERGIRIVALQSLLYGRPDLVLFGSNASRRALVDYIAGLTALARALGAHALVFGSPRNRQRRSVPMSEAIVIATEFFQEVGSVATANETVICLEPNPPTYGCDFITTTAAAVAQCQRVDNPGIMVQGDLGAMTILGDPPTSAIDMAGPRLGHFHASEPDLVELGSTPVGSTQHEQAARALRHCGYARWISIEMRKVDGREESLERVKRALQFATRVYGPSTDEMNRGDGL